MNAAGMELLERFRDYARHDLAAVEDAVARALGEAPATDNQFAAMVCLACDIGPGCFKASTVCRAHKEGDRQTAAAAFLLWTLHDGDVHRRLAEAHLYQAPGPARRPQPTATEETR